MKQLKILLTVFAFVLLFGVGKANAQWTVIDPSNIAQSIVNNSKSLVQETSTAQNMIKNFQETVKWRKEKREAFASREREAMEAEEAESRTLKLTEFVTANDLAVMMNVPVNNVIATCMNIGVMVSINQRLDAETINIVADEFGYKTEYVSAEVVEAIQSVEDTEDQLTTRPPHRDCHGPCGPR